MQDVVQNSESLEKWFWAFLKAIVQYKFKMPSNVGYDTVQKFASGNIFLMFLKVFDQQYSKTMILWNIITIELFSVQLYSNYSSLQCHMILQKSF